MEKKINIDFDPENFETDEISRSELKDIYSDIIGRQKGGLMELSPYATDPAQATRHFSDEERSFSLPMGDSFLTDFFRCRWNDSFNRLAGKKQVASPLSNDNITNRLTHPLRVGAINTALAYYLGEHPFFALTGGENHDLGHSPEGHEGEKRITRAILNFNRDLLGVLGIFKHNIHSFDIVRRIERRSGYDDKFGLNLTRETENTLISHDGEVERSAISPEYHIRGDEIENRTRDYRSRIIKASGSMKFNGNPDDFEEVEDFLSNLRREVDKQRIIPVTLGGGCTCMADVIAYIASDFEDYIKRGVITREELRTKFPDIAETLGENSGDMVNKLIRDIVIHSYYKPVIRYSEKMAEYLNKLKYDFLYPLYFRESINTPGERIISVEDLQIMMDKLFVTYVKALENPFRFPDVSINSNYFAKRDRVKYMEQMDHIPKDYRHFQAVIDYIASFTDRYLYEQYRKL